MANTVANAVRGRINHDEATANFGGLNMGLAELRAVDRIVMPSCGTSWHAALVGEHLFEEFAHVPAEVEYASEFRYRNAPLEKHTLVLVITQSGETVKLLCGETAEQSQRLDRRRPSHSRSPWLIPDRAQA